jgi:hypothetical protein
MSIITLAYLHSKRGSLRVKNQKWMRVLFDTGCSSTIVNYKLVNKLKKTKSHHTNWTTKAGNFKTDQKVKVKFILPGAFHDNRDIEWTCYVDGSGDNLSRYDMIIGRDLIQELQMDFLFSDKLMVWDNASTPMRSPDFVEALASRALLPSSLFSVSNLVIPEESFSMLSYPVLVDKNLTYSEDTTEWFLIPICRKDS